MARDSGRSNALATSRETHGYDGVRGRTKWWFEAWGSGPKADWHKRDDIRRPPRPEELVNADYVVLGFDTNGSVQYKTHVGGLDLRR